jgi:dipeptidyl aminopeptidase/acylaminoacyl peptidase
MRDDLEPVCDATLTRSPRRFARLSVPLLAWLFAGVATSAGVPVRAAPPPIAAFAAEGDYDAIALSPNGRHMVFVRTDAGTGARGLYGLDLQQRTSRALLPAYVDAFAIAWCGFKGDDRVLCSYYGIEMIEGRPAYTSRLVSVPFAGGKARVLVQRSSRGASQFQDRIVDWQHDDPKAVLIQLDEDRNVYPSVLSLNLESGAMRTAQREREPVTTWMTDRDGRIRLGFGYRGTSFQLITRDSVDDDWRLLERWKGFGNAPFGVLGFGPQPQTILVSASHNGRDAIFEVNLANTDEKQLLFARPDVDVGGALRWPNEDRIIGFHYETDKPQRFLFDSEAASIQASIDKALPGAINELVDSSRDRQKLLVTSYSDRQAPLHFLLDRSTGSLLRVGASRATLDPATMAAQQPVRIPGPAGVMQGYLTVPAGVARPAKGAPGLPLIVMPHGGPFARDSWGFDPVLQFLASRGYAVLQVNFRGSTGYGDEWYEAGLRNWGSVMVDDISAATRWAIAEGVADPARTCIVGWSYGGYAALMSAVREPQLYRCVVSIAGVSDLKALLEQQSRFFGGRERGRYSVGSDSDELKAGSPLRAAERIVAPVLMVHGTHDVSVVIDQSRVMARALGRADKPHELVVIEDGDHALSRSAWRTTLFTKLEAFLATHLSGAAATSPTASARTP